MTQGTGVRVVRRALISVFDKAGIVEFAKALHERDVALVSTGGTYRALQDAGLPVTEVAKVTGFPECFDGRVKTLHPKIHGGILFRRDLGAHVDKAAELEIAPIDLVVVNLYPFEAARDKPGATRDEIIEMIDIGGPGMVRAAAKNHDAVGVVTDPSQYDRIAAELAAEGGLSGGLLRELAAAAFATTARYDAAIAAYMTADCMTVDGANGASSDAAATFPDVLSLTYRRAAEMRYGENPHQSAALYLEPDQTGPFGPYAVLGGKALSYNNLLDAQAALNLVRDLSTVTGAKATCAVIKHQSPCGAGSGDDVVSAYERAFSGDPLSAFGGIVAFDCPVDRAAVDAMIATKQFVEVVIAPKIEAEALDVAAASKGGWKNTRFVEVANPAPPRYDLRPVEGGLLVQTPDDVVTAKFDVASKRQPTDAERRDLAIADVIAKHVKSNAIVLVKDGVLVGAGGGQTSRVDSVEIAVRKAGDRATGAMMGSDAFFPFADGIEVAAAAGVAGAIEPGGSRRDDEVIAAADKLGMVLVMTGTRHFRH